MLKFKLKAKKGQKIRSACPFNFNKILYIGYIYEENKQRFARVFDAENEIEITKAPIGFDDRIFLGYNSVILKKGFDLYDLVRGYQIK